MRISAITITFALVLFAGCTDAIENRDANFVVEPNEVPTGEAPNATLTNTSDTILEFGSAFQLEREESGGWKAYGEACVFDMMLRHLQPGKSISQDVVACRDERGSPQQLEVGSYRVSKDVSPSGGDQFTVQATFDVIAP